MKKILLTCTLVVTTMSFAQTFSVPDPNFEQALIDLNLDRTSPTDEIDGVVGFEFISDVEELDVSFENISDLTGIENFTSLLELSANNNNLTSVNLSSNQNLTKLFIQGNDLTQLDVSNLSSLQILWCQSNELTNLSLPTSSSLQRLECQMNNLTSLDLSNAESLERIYAQNNQLSTLDFSANTLLEEITVDNNNLTSINIENCALLEKVEFNNNALTDLEIVDKPNLFRILLQFNDLTSLTVRNVDSGNFNFNINLLGNDNLTCVEVSDPDESTNEWTNVESQVFFSTDCSSTGGETVSIPDPYFEDYLESIGAGNGIDFDGLADLASVQSLTSVDLSGLGTVESLEGIEFFSSLTSLNASGNSIESVDLSLNTPLTFVNLSDNLLTNIDVSNNTNLTSLNVANNNLTTLDVSNVSNLEILRCASNQLTELDVVANTALTELNCSSNSLTQLNLLSNVNLEQLYAESNSLEYLDLSQNASLNTVTVIMNSLMGLNLKNGNNTAISNASFAAFDNPALSCIQVDDVSYSNSNWGQIDMASSFSENCTPVNDDCSFTIPITLGQDTPGDTTSASAGANNPNCAQNGIVLFDVWYQVEAPASGSIVLNLSAQPLIAKIAIYNSCSDAQPFACDEDTLSVDNLIPGQTYFLQVWLESNSGGRTSSTGETGSFTLNAQDATVLSNQEEEKESLSLLVYPNPTNGDVHLKLTNSDIITSVEVYSLLGKRVLVKKNVQEILNLSPLSKGIYMIRVEGTNGTYTKKLIKN